MTDWYDRLVHPWTLQVEVAGHPVTQAFNPLIDELAVLVRPSSNTHGGAGSPATRNLIDTKALDLLTLIQDTTVGWLREWGLHGTGTTRGDIIRYRTHADTLHASGAIDTPQWERFTGIPDVWASRIWDLLEPPLQRPLRDSSCPRCDTRKTVTEAGETVDALVVERRVGQEVTAVCRAVGCTATWVGEDGLKGLGRELGIEFNTEALTPVHPNGSQS